MSSQTATKSPTMSKSPDYPVIEGVDWLRKAELTLETRFFHYPKSGPRLKMALLLLRKLAEHPEDPSVSLHELTKEAGERYADYGAAWGTPAFPKIRERMRKFLDDFRDQLKRDELKSPALRDAQGRKLELTYWNMNPAGSAMLQPASGLEPKEPNRTTAPTQTQPQIARRSPAPTWKEIVFVAGAKRVGKRQCAIGLFTAYVTKGQYLHINPVRISDRWAPNFLPDSKAFENWARKAPKFKNLFRKPKHYVDPSGWPLTGKGKGQVTFSEETQPKKLFNGWLWGVANAAMDQRNQGSRLLTLEVERILFRDYMAFRSNRVVPTDWSKQSLPAEDWIRERWHHAARDAYLPVHAAVSICVLVVLERKGEAHVVLALRNNPDRTSGEWKRKMWHVSASGMAVSERLREDARGPGFETQARRLLRRQLALDLPDAEVRWIGASLSPNLTSAILYSVVHVSATPAEIFDLFNRRTIRHDATQLAVVSHRQVRAFLEKKTRNAMTLFSLQKSPHANRAQTANALPTALGLWMLSRGEANVVGS